MRNTLLRFVLIGIVSLMATSGFAQPGQRFTTKSKKAQEAYNQAYQDMRIRQLPEALLSIDKAIKKDDAFIEAWMLKSRILQNMGKTDEAIEPLETAVAINPEFFPNNFLVLAELYHATGYYDKVKSSLKTFDGYGAQDQELKMRSSLLSRSADFARHATANPVPFDPQNVGAGINTGADEYFPCITADNKTILFTRLVPSNQFGKQEDFYTSSFNGEAWDQAMGMPEINTEGNEGAPTLSADGRILIFTACEIADGLYTGNRQGAGSCDLFYAERIGDRWSTPQNLSAKVNSGYWESQPSYSADGRTLYFVRGKLTGRGYEGMDIYTARLGLDGNWGRPEKISDKINTPFEEQSVLIHPDGQTLYFSSNGHPGMGGADIFMSRKGKDGEWQDPINLGYPINTAKDENSIMINAGGDVAFFASNREGGFGGLDIYSFELPREMRPNPVSYTSGKVFDAETKKPLAGFFELIDLETKKTIVRSSADPETGEFLVCLPAGREYGLNVSKEGYLFYSDNFNLTGSSSDVLGLQVPLSPYKSGEKVVLKNVFFDSDSYVLKPNSIAELDKLTRLIKNNKELTIVINGHTDDVGNDKSNLKLSKNRAQAVVEYLIEKGIESSRLSSQGFGESKPLVANDSDENRAINRRTEFEVR